MGEVSITNLRASRWRELHLILALPVGYSGVKVQLIQLRVDPSWKDVRVGKKESAEFSVQNFRGNSMRRLGKESRIPKSYTPHRPGNFLQILGFLNLEYPGWGRGSAVRALPGAQSDTNHGDWHPL